MLTISKENASYLNIAGAIEDKIPVSEHFARHVPGYFFDPLYKTGRWDGKIRFFDLGTGRLPYGLYKELFSFCSKNKIPLEISDELKKELLPVSVNDLDICFGDIDTKNIQQREYQLNGVAQALKWKRGLLKHPTGAGKTATLFLLINYLLKKDFQKILFIVPTKGLLAQTEAAFISYGFDKSLI